MSENELATTSTQTSPSLVQAAQGDSVDQADLVIPRAKLMQAMSPEVADGEATPGQIINSLTLEELPEVFTPVFHTKTWTRFNPRNKQDPDFDSAYEPGGIIYRTDDPNDAQLNNINESGWCDKVFGPNGERPRATVTLSFMAYFEGVDMPLILSLYNTSYKTGKQLLTLTQFKSPYREGGHTFQFGWNYSLTATQQETDGNKYFVYKVKAVERNSEETIEHCKDWYMQFAPKKTEIAHTSTGESNWEE